MPYNIEELSNEMGVYVHKERLSGYKYVVSYGGGVNSTALCLKLIAEKCPIDLVLFADTGFEDPVTYRFIKVFASYLMDRNVPIAFCTKYRRATKTEPRRREPINDWFMRRREVPDQKFRECTRVAKIAPIHKVYREQLKSNIIEYIGIHKKETRRLKPSRDDDIIKCYPLVDFEMDQDDCVTEILSCGLELPVKSSCVNCFAHKWQQFYKLWNDTPELFWESVKIEENGKSFAKGYYYAKYKGIRTPLRELAKIFEDMKNLDFAVVEDENDDDDDTCDSNYCMT